MDVQEQENNPSKERKNFAEAIEKLAELMGGEKNLRPSTKVTNAVFGNIVNDLLQEEEKSNAESVKSDLKTLLKGYALLEDEMEKKRKELDQLETNKMKEFTKTAQSLFRRVEGFGQKKDSFTRGLSAAAGSETKPEAK